MGIHFLFSFAVIVAPHEGPGMLREPKETAGIRSGRILRRISDAGGGIFWFPAKQIKFFYIPIVKLIKI